MKSKLKFTCVRDVSQVLEIALESPEEETVSDFPDTGSDETGGKETVGQKAEDREAGGSNGDKTRDPAPAKKQAPDRAGRREDSGLEYSGIRVQPGRDGQ